MIYSCIEYKTDGANGTSLFPKAKEGSSLVLIGERLGRKYYAGLADVNQHSEIDLRHEVMDFEIDEMIKKSQFASAAKQTVRNKVSRDVGDVYDLVADQAKMIEFLLMLTCRMADSYLGGVEIPSDVKAVYLSRVQAILNAVDADQVLLRTQLEDSDIMAQRLLFKQDAINQIVKQDYLDKLKELIDAV